MATDVGCSTGGNKAEASLDTQLLAGMAVGEVSYDLSR